MVTSKIDRSPLRGEEQPSVPRTRAAVRVASNVAQQRHDRVCSSKSPSKRISPCPGYERCGVLTAEALAKGEGAVLDLPGQGRSPSGLGKAATKRRSCTGCSDSPGKKTERSTPTTAPPAPSQLRPRHQCGCRCRSIKHKPPGCRWEGRCAAGHVEELPTLHRKAIRLVLRVQAAIGAGLRVVLGQPVVPGTAAGVVAVPFRRAGTLNSVPATCLRRGRAADAGDRRQRSQSTLQGAGHSVLPRNNGPQPSEGDLAAGWLTTLAKAAKAGVGSVPVARGPVAETSASGSPAPW